MSAPAQRARRERARRYRRRTGQERHMDPYPDAFLTAWRDAHRDAGLAGAWTHVPPASAVAALRDLAEHGASVGSTIATRANVSQGNLTARGLPRLEVVGLVTCERGPNSRGAANRAWIWSLTERGRAFVALLGPSS